MVYRYSLITVYTLQHIIAINCKLRRALIYRVMITLFYFAKRPPIDKINKIVQFVNNYCTTAVCNKNNNNNNN